MTSVLEQLSRFRPDNDRPSNLWMARSDVTVREWLASRTRRTKWKCPARLVAALVGKGSPSAPLRAGFRLRKPIRFANRFATLRMTVPDRLYTSFFLGRRLNSGEPHVPADSRAPKRITASMLERPWGDQ